MPLLLWEHDSGIGEDPRRTHPFLGGTRLGQDSLEGGGQILSAPRRPFGVL